MDAQHPSYGTGAATVLAPDLGSRLQQLVAAWRGAERGQPLDDLHRECSSAAGPGGRAILPGYLLLVEGLTAATLREELARLPRIGREAGPVFRVPPQGRFDAALVPVGQAGEMRDRWVLAVERGLQLEDQVALYGHALGHLLLNRDAVQMGAMPPLDPAAGYAHSDMLPELRQLVRLAGADAARRPIDRRVLDTYPLLTALLRVRDDVATTVGLMPADFRDRLAESGWRGIFVETPYVFTRGRVFVSGASVVRGPKLREDALLRAEASLPIGLVHSLRSSETREEAERRLAEYAHERMALPFAYLLEDEAVHELDWTRSNEPARATLPTLPKRDELWARWVGALRLGERREHDALRYPYEIGSGRQPRYYQEAAINRAVMAALQARRGLRSPRILLTLATGTGKTPVAFQIVWKLKKTFNVSNVLFLTDRDYLLGQAMDTHFTPFAEARARVTGKIDTAHDVIFATYQAIADAMDRPGLYRDYPRDFFDLVIVDECHRGSAAEDAAWRTILAHFGSAVQIGLTATPLRTGRIQTDAYFGPSLATYSLRRGITDGFLAPYRVRRVLMGLRTETAPPAMQDDTLTDDAPETDRDTAGEGNEPAVAVVEVPDIEETAHTLKERTSVIAGHLAAYLKRTDPLAKTIVFCVDQAHAEEMRLALMGHFAEEVRRYPDYVTRIVSDEHDDGRRALGRFTNPEARTPVIVTTSKLLTTGVDVPTCKNIVLARPIGSLVDFKQIIGRGTRLHEPDKTWFTIVDYAGATRLFFDPGFDGDPELVELESLVPARTPAAGESERTVDASPGEGVPDATTTQSGAEGPQGDSVELPPIADVAVGADAAPLAQAEHVGFPGLRVAEAPMAPRGRPQAPAPGANGHVDPSGGTASTPTLAMPVPGPEAVPAPTAQAGPQPRPPDVMPTAAWPPSPRQLAAAARPRPSDGRRIAVIGEIVYELGPDGRTLSARSYQDYMRDALHGICASPTELRARWLRQEQRDEIRARLEEQGINVDELAAALGLPDADPLDLLLHVAFGQHALTRRERADRVIRERADFFARYAPAAREILDLVLEKYVRGEAPDVSNPELLRVPPISERGTFIELAGRFGGGEQVRRALGELEVLLYGA